jgi:hypothetical protein
MAQDQVPAAVDGDIAAGRATAELLFDLGLRQCIGRNYIAAHKWLNLAALKGSAEARRHRGELAREMTGEEICEAQRQARDWLRLH